jgi:hypothetical protein
MPIGAVPGKTIACGESVGWLADPDRMRPNKIHALLDICAPQRIAARHVSDKVSAG